MEGRPAKVFEFAKAILETGMIVFQFSDVYWCWKYVLFDGADVATEFLVSCINVEVYQIYKDIPVLTALTRRYVKP